MAHHRLSYLKTLLGAAAAGLGTLTLVDFTAPYQATLSTVDRSPGL